MDQRKCHLPTAFPCLAELNHYNPIHVYTPPVPVLLDEQPMGSAVHSALQPSSNAGSESVRVSSGLGLRFWWRLGFRVWKSLGLG
eukprot:363347-Chlamydomonas_euryale.AAC.8